MSEVTISPHKMVGGAIRLERILILTQYFPPEPGAPQIRLAAVARELKRNGIEVEVLTGMPNYPVGRIFDGYRGKLSLREEVDGIPVRRLWLYPAAGRNVAGRLANYLSFTITAGMVLLGCRRVDLVFVEAQPVTLALPAWLVTKLRGIPYVYNTPDLQIEYAEEGGWIGARYLTLLARRLEARLMRDALSVSTVTHAFIRHFADQRQIPIDQLTFLPNGADTGRLRPLPRDETYAARLGVGGRKVFTYAGTHAHYQGLEVLLEAAKLLRHRSDIALLMVGKGPLRSDLEAQAERAGLENLLFRDSPFEEMHRLMSVTYASLVVLRDMAVATKMRLSKTIPPLACGVPVIYAGRGESAEILVKHQCGVTVEPERPDLLARAIETLADDPDSRDAMGLRGRDLAEREFSWSFLVSDWLRQIRAVAAGEAPEVPGLAGTGGW